MSELWKCIFVGKWGLKSHCKAHCVSHAWTEIGGIKRKVEYKQQQIWFHWGVYFSQALEATTMPLCFNIYGPMCVAQTSIRVLTPLCRCSRIAPSCRNWWQYLQRLLIFHHCHNHFPLCTALDCERQCALPEKKHPQQVHNDFRKNKIKSRALVFMHLL